MSSDDTPRFDRGQPVTIAIAWEADPEEVFFAYVAPGEEVAVVDDGCGQPSSRIEELDAGAFSFTIPTSRFRPGVCHWRFWGEVGGECVVSKYGKFEVVGGPPQL